MGIINVTPDSFSDGGHSLDADDATHTAVGMAAEGAAIIDIGAESTRPDAVPIGGDVERERLLPALAAIMAALPDMPISIDTYRPDTARAALEAGAHIINDICGLQRNPDIAAVAADHGAGLVIMHTGRDRAPLDDVIVDQRAFLSRSIEIALAAGVDERHIVLDPGFGFGKDAARNVALMARFAELHELGFPFLAGTSRKRFLGHVTGRDVADRDAATAATSALLRSRGAAILRVHNVAMNADAVAIADAALAAGRDNGAGETRQTNRV